MCGPSPWSGCTRRLRKSLFADGTWNAKPHRLAACRALRASAHAACHRPHCVSSPVLRAFARVACHQGTGPHPCCVPSGQRPSRASRVIRAPALARVACHQGTGPRARCVSSGHRPSRASRALARVACHQGAHHRASRVIQSAWPHTPSDTHNEREGSPPKTRMALATIPSWTNESDRRSFALIRQVLQPPRSGALDDTLCAMAGAYNATLRAPGPALWMTHHARRPAP